MCLALLYFHQKGNKIASKYLQNFLEYMEFCCKHYTFFIFLKCPFILVEIWSTFAAVSHLNIIPVAYWGSNFSKKHCFYSWPIYAVMIFEKKFHLAEWGAFYQMSKFSYFEGSISSLFLKLLLHYSAPLSDRTV